MREECGVAAITAAEDVAGYLYYCLFALQHRGQEACGIVCFATDKVHSRKSFGLVSDSFDPAVLNTLPGTTGVGHVRYSTQGGMDVENIQPFSCQVASIGTVALAHNGNLTNSHILRQQLEEEGAIFRSSSDTEIFMHLLARTQGEDIVARLQEIKKNIRGAYALVLAEQDKIYGMRDAFGFRPLVIGRKKGTDCWVLVSESCALDLIEADFVREVEPGEIVAISAAKGVVSFRGEKRKKSFCSFEPIYFSRPDSVIFDREVYSLRKAIGMQLALEDQAIDSDVVIAIPDSGVPMAMGYGEQTKIPVEMGFIRNHYVGRTFIQPDQKIRDFAVKLKLNPLPRSLEGKRVTVVDDSLVRGTTAKKILRVLRNKGVTKIHLRIGSPPIKHPCLYGIDTPDRDQLIAANHSTTQICQLLGADSLSYLSLQGLQSALEENRNGYCYACFTGKYAEKPQCLEK